MEVKFNVTLDDYATYILYKVNPEFFEKNRSIGDRAPSGRRYFLRFVGLLLLGGFLIFQLVVLIQFGVNLQWFGWLLFSLFFGYKLLFSDWENSDEERMKKSVHQQHKLGMLDRVLGDQQLQLTPQALIQITNSQVSTIPWSAIEEIARAEEYVFFCRNRNPQETIIIPKRAFSTETEFGQFAETACSYKKSATEFPNFRPKEKAETGFYRQSNEELEVVYKLIPKDGIAAARQTPIPTSLITGGPIATLFIVVPLVLLVVAIINNLPRIPQNAFGIIMIIWGIFLLLGLLGFIILLLFPLNPFLLSFLKRRISDQPEYNDSTHRLRLTPDHLIQAVDSLITATPWAVVEKIVIAVDYAFFHTSRFVVLVLPKRAFAQESEFTEFVEMANKYHRAVHQSQLAYNS
jgi:hypothetical protein